VTGWGFTLSGGAHISRDTLAFGYRCFRLGNGMSVAESNKRLSEAEFLQFERRAQSKSEFFDGEMFAMAGGTRTHSLIATNLTRELGNRLKGRPCVTCNADLRVKVEATGLLTYPDVSVVCGPQRFLDAEEDTLLNPLLIGEVLSDSTEAYDRGKKFAHYRLMPSLRLFLLVSQKEPRFELFSHTGGDEWRLREVAGLEATLELAALEITIALSEVFAQVAFSPVPTRLHP
jgi:Uma2 family endonuclease